MDGLTSTIVSAVVTLVAAIIGFLGAVLLQKRGRKQSLIDAIMQKRMTAYSEALSVLYEVEQNQADPDKLDKVTDRWGQWFPLNAVYLPPSLNDSFFKAMASVAVVSVDLHNEGRLDSETRKEFRQRLDEAKQKLMGLHDIGWLPKELQ